MQTKSFHKQRGFTLVEMLIVIVIIGVLAAALIPRLTSVRSRANDVARKADIQQLTTAIISYQIDNNGELPGAAPGEIFLANSGYSVDSVQQKLLDAGLDSIPVDPSPANKVIFNAVDSGNIGQYGYIIVQKNGVPKAGFVLMAKTETAGGSNRIISGAVGFIYSGTDAQSILPCEKIKNTVGAAVLVTGGTCLYNNADQLRYILVR